MSVFDGDGDGGQKEADRHWGDVTVDVAVTVTV